jgi:transaldolase
MDSLQNLIKYGQSYWLDNLTRGMITSNDLHTRVMQQGLRGITSNPSRQILCDLEAVGIDLDCVTWQLQHEGVQTFLDPFDDLMDTLAQKCS